MMRTFFLFSFLEDLPQLPLGGGSEEHIYCLSFLTDIIEGSFDPDLDPSTPVAFFPQSFLRKAAVISTTLLGVAHALSLKLWLMR